MSKRRPDHAHSFKGAAKNIPARDSFMLPYQSKWIKDKSLLKVMEKSRRVGISYATAYDLVRQHSVRGYKSDSWVSSRDEASAKLFLMDCKKFAESLDVGAKYMGERVLDESGANAFVQRYSNGTDINSLSSNPDAFAGKGGNVTNDEFALRKDPKMVWDISLPSIDWGGRLGIISTHRGSGNYFNTLIREAREKGNPKNISLHRVTLEDALDQGFLWKLQTKLVEGDERMEMDEAAYFAYIKDRASDNESFLQEYMCVPGDDAAAFLEYALIDACCYKEEEDWEYTLDEARACKNPLYAGVDIGRHHDLTSLFVFEKVGGQMLTRHRIDLKNVEFSTQAEILYPWFEVCRRTCIDKSGLGMQFAEDATKRFGTYRVEGVTFTNQSKEAMAYPVRAAFEDRAIRIPFDLDLKTDLRAVRKEVTASGNIRFAADRGTNGHADRFWALALAVEAGKPASDQYYAGLC